MIRDMQCCGVYEIHDLTRPLQVILKEVTRHKNAAGRGPFNLYVFTDHLNHIQERTQYQLGEELAEAIKFYSLGPVSTLSSVKNPNTGHDIQAWLWSPDHKKIRTWLKKTPDGIKQDGHSLDCRRRLDFTTYPPVPVGPVYTHPWRKDAQK